MFNEKLSFRLFAFSNLIAAFGGGMILGKGVAIIDTPYLQGGSILAFFIGTVLGLVFLQSIPKSFSKSVGRLFSILGGLTSLILFEIYNNGSNEKLSGTIALVFFSLLSIRFGFWFFSRVMRASSAAGQGQTIAWVELGYYVGIILGLIIWKFFNIHIELGAALLLDASLQFSAGIIDFLGREKKSKDERYNNHITQHHSMKPYDLVWGWRLSITVVFLTIATQVVIFNLAHHVPEVLGSYILAIFYFGVAIAAYFCHRYQIYLTWDDKNQLANICSDKILGTMKLNLSMLIAVLTITVTITVYIVNYWSLKSNPDFMQTLATSIVYLGVFCAAFIYETLTLAILDKMGFEEKAANHTGMVMRTYGLMGVGAVMSLWLLGITNNFLQPSLLMTGCTLPSALFLALKRSIAIYNETPVENLTVKGAEPPLPNP